jgi:hypothetical protein
MRKTLLWIVGLLQLVVAAMMLLAPQSFYGLVPGVNETGPFNPHFVRDVGAAFLVAGGGLWYARDVGRGRQRWLAPASGAAPSFICGTAWRDASGPCISSRSAALFGVAVLRCGCMAAPRFNSM